MKSYRRYEIFWERRERMRSIVVLAVDDIDPTMGAREILREADAYDVWDALEEHCEPLERDYVIESAEPIGGEVTDDE